MTTQPQTNSALASVPGAITKIGCALMGSGEGAKAVALVNSLLAGRPDDPELLSAARMILSHAVPQWHGQMLADSERNGAFERAIARAVSKGGTLLDIGTGSGLLALMAARAGATSVYACEANTALAETAREIVALNGYGDVIQVIPKRSTELTRDGDLGGGADVIVAEVFSDDVVGEGALPTLQHAAAELARPGARIIPASASARIALAYREYKGRNLRDVEGFDLSPFERHFPPHRPLLIGDKNLHLRSEPRTLFEFDFQRGTPFRNERAELRLTASGGAANGVVRWIRLQLDEQEIYENAPQQGKQSHWGAWFDPLPGEALEAGESISLHAAHDQERVHLWFSRP